MVSDQLGEQQGVDEAGERRARVFVGASRYWRAWGFSSSLAGPGRSRGWSSSFLDNHSSSPPAARGGTVETDGSPAGGEKSRGGGEKAAARGQGWIWGRNRRERGSR